MSELRQMLTEDYKETHTTKRIITLSDLIDDVLTIKKESVKNTNAYGSATILEKKLLIILSGTAELEMK